ncbi:MAG: tetratricopeptide repeat protein [Rhodospirillales bacterium]
MPSTVIPGADALKRRKTNAQALWPEGAAALGRVRPLALARIDAPFTVDADASVAAAGDAFAHALVRAFAALGHSAPADERLAPHALSGAEAEGGPPCALSPHAIDAAFARALPAPRASGAASGAPGTADEDKGEDEHTARARRLRDWIFSAAASADLIIMLPQTAEVWRDEIAGVYIDAPGPGVLENSPLRCALHLADADEVRRAFESACEHIREARRRRGAPPARFAVGVSPVPLAETYSGDDVLLADARIKAALLLGARALADAHEDIVYLPVYETVARSAPHAAFEEDGRTVRPEVLDVAARRIRAALVKPPGVSAARTESSASGPGPQRAGALAASAHALTGRFYDDAAVEGLRRAARENPDDPAAHMRLARLLMQGGRPRDAAEALRDATAAARRTPDLAAAQHGLGLAEIRAGRLAEAETALRAAGDLRPVDAAVRLDLGCVLWALGRPAEAEAELRRACDLAPESAAAHLELGKLLRARARPGAAEALSRAAELAPGEASAHHELGQALLAQNEHVKALNALRRAAELDPAFGER